MAPIRKHEVPMTDAEVAFFHAAQAFAASFRTYGTTSITTKLAADGMANAWERIVTERRPEPKRPWKAGDPGPGPSMVTGS